ncbi:MULTISPECIES: AMP-binding protein [unclassified Bradyrhizobium]
MSVLDMLRTVHSAPSMDAKCGAGAREATSLAALERALQNAAITIPQLLRERAALHGDGLALREKEYGIWNRYSWRHYYETARAVALGLLSLGIKPGDRVAIAGEDTPEWFYADLGTQMIGAIAVGIYPTNPWVELQYIVRHSGSRIVVTGDQEQTDKVLEAMAKEGGLPALEAIICIDMKGLRHYRQEQLVSFDKLCELGRTYAAEHPEANATLDRLISQGAPDDTCILVYTSGTTGPPKGAMLTNRNLIYSAYTYAGAVGIADKQFESVCYPHALDLGTGRDVVRIGSIGVRTGQIAVIATLVLLLAGIWAFFRYSKFGVAMRAVAADDRTALLMGIIIAENVAMMKELEKLNVKPVTGIFWPGRIEPC